MANRFGRRQRRAAHDEIARLTAETDKLRFQIGHLFREQGRLASVNAGLLKVIYGDAMPDASAGDPAVDLTDLPFRQRILRIEEHADMQAHAEMTMVVSQDAWPTIKALVHAFNYRGTPVVRVAGKSFMLSGVDQREPWFGAQRDNEWTLHLRSITSTGLALTRRLA